MIFEDFWTTELLIIIVGLIIILPLITALILKRKRFIITENQNFKQEMKQVLDYELPNYVLKQEKVFHVAKYVVYPFPTVNGQPLPEPTSLFSTKRFYLTAIIFTLVLMIAIYWMFAH